MSAFIVDDSTINNVVSFIERDSRGSGMMAYNLNNLLREYSDQGGVIDFAFIAQAMHTLNREAVNCRYDSTEPVRVFNYVYNSDLPNICQIIKSAQCWRYQCTESDELEATRIYKLIDSMIDVLRIDVVETQPEYQAAQWG